MAQLSKLILPFDRDNNTTATYFEAISFYQALAEQYPKQVRFSELGETDSGFPLHQAVLSVDGTFSPEAAHAAGHQVLFINNGIHPGEPCGVDASMIFLRSQLQDAEKLSALQGLVIVVIPFYNIGGGLNRGPYSRANQNGPQAYGFRGNARNLDLNRDFIKCDSRNARAFNQAFARWQPDVFIDTHTSNGADYTYTMTLIPTQSDKLAPPLAAYLDGQLLPRLYSDMKAEGWEMTPYVYARETPDEGIAAFLDLPRYSSGYAALHHCIGFMPETHMLKPYASRVNSTCAFIGCVARAMQAGRPALQEARKQALAQTAAQDTFSLNWSLSSVADSIVFKGYEAKYKPSEVSGLSRLYYDRSSPYEKDIPYFRTYRPAASVRKPIAYLIPQAYAEVVERLQWNGVTALRLAEDVEAELDFYYIDDYKTVDSPYEGHYLHHSVRTSTRHLRRLFRKGDYVVFANQPSNRYIVETLEPEGADSFFAWNFFDGILMQKEYFSAYVFEDLAAEMLRNDPELKKELEQKKEADEHFAQSARAQLNFIYEHSPYYEPTYRLYPVGRLMEPLGLPLAGQE
ncbi:MAG: hypothetical protein H6564_22155 [Lewinellaceae bacterium]|nr:hypothetical protein [Lewinellaceae bacterium]